MPCLTLVFLASIRSQARYCAVLTAQMMLEKSKSQLTYAMRVVATPERHPVLIHCTHGKDRTGLVVALILACAGVPDEAIVADYVASARHGGTALAHEDLVRTTHH
jgi:hypothetical protein